MVQEPVLASEGGKLFPHICTCTEEEKVNQPQVPHQKQLLWFATFLSVKGKKKKDLPPTTKCQDWRLVVWSPRSSAASIWLGQPCYHPDHSSVGVISGRKRWIFQEEEGLRMPFSGFFVCFFVAWFFVVLICFHLCAFLKIKFKFTSNYSCKNGEERELWNAWIKKELI